MRLERVCLGIHVHAQPDRLRATLDSLRRHTRHPAEIVLLPDGADAETQVALSALGDLPQLVADRARGAPACFNRLVTSAEADLYVLLESGSLVGPGWLDYLLRALDADPRHGLVGPSTNRAWNEQGAFPRSRGTAAGVVRAAEIAARRFGDARRTLEPLHSLADFCYAVRQEVIEAIGAADEGYGLGPCWEMDYNVRAARAGFRGVWACGAFVYRSPFTARRRREEARRFQASKQRYQDKFCALRLRRERNTYETHCRGDACDHFAPPDLIQIKLPFPVVEPALAPVSDASPSKKARPVVSERGHRRCPEAAPLVSCILPTRDRGDFVLQSIRYFQRQDYPALELVIVDDGGDELAGQLPDDPRIRYLRLPPGQSIGAKRNRACAAARGEIVAQWDDDDWYAPNRLSAQVAPLLDGTADISGLTDAPFLDMARWAFWRCSSDLHRRLFVGDVIGGTLVYWRWVWQELARYPDRCLAEDATFLQKAIRRGARLDRVAGDGLFIYLRHADNSWSFRCGQYLDPDGWRRTPEPDLPPEDRAFYSARSPAASEDVPSDQSTSPAAAKQPLVSCIMPTADRRRWVPQAIDYFLRQDYPNRELIVVDDGADAVGDLIPPDPRIQYVRLEGKRTVGAKRNLACQRAGGEIIVHWDDDDWMAPWRLSYQVAGLLEEGADICGLDRVLYFDPRSEKAWQYVYPSGGRPWVAGNTLCYSAALWRQNPFPDINVGEDTRFVWSGCSKEILAVEDSTFLVALIHRDNTSPKRPAGSRWHPYPGKGIQDLIGEDWPFYVSLGQEHALAPRH